MLANIVAVMLFVALVSSGHHPIVHACIQVMIVILMGSGLVFFFATSVGMLRFPDCFTRLHAAGKGDTLSTILILLACALFVIDSAHHVDKTAVLTAIKILLIIHFIFIGSPTATHALMDAADQSDVQPWKGSS